MMVLVVVVHGKENRRTRLKNCKVGANTYRVQNSQYCNLLAAVRCHVMTWLVISANYVTLLLQLVFAVLVLL